MSKFEGKERRVARRSDGAGDSERCGAARGRPSHCFVDHANKRRDRERPNPNRALIGRLRAAASLPSYDRPPKTERSGPPDGDDD